jgi:hypothetical protein
MKILLSLAMSCLLAGGALAQRGGGHGGGMGGGGMRSAGSGGMRSGGGSGFRGSGGSGFRGGSGGIVRGGGYSGFRGGYNNGYGYRGSYGYRGNYGYRGYGFRNNFFYGGYSYWPSYWGLRYGVWPGYYSGYAGYYPYDYGYGYGYDSAYETPAYYSQPNVTVVYPSAQTQAVPNTVYVERANPVVREYDQYGQEVAQPAGGGTSSPIYLIAFKDQMIRAAISYTVSGGTLHYVNLQHEEKQVPLDTIDRDLTIRLNRERRVSFQLP